MAAAPATAVASSAGAPTSYAPPPLDLAPLTPAEIDAFFRGGEPEADECERILVRAARASGAIDVAIAEGLHALRQRDRLAALAFHLDDYAREVLDIGEHAAGNLARLGRDLPTRPLLADALRSGRVRLRAAQTVLKVAVGDAEAAWVERAARLTVRELEVLVRSEAAGCDEDEEWMRLGAHLRPEERIVLDEALAVAGTVLPGASRIQRLEAMAQEFLGAYPPEQDTAPSPGNGFRPLARDEERRAATLEAETERWAALPEIGDVPAPDVRFYETATAQDVDAKLRELARLKSQTDDIVGYCARAVRESKLHKRLGFENFRRYCKDRLGLAPRTVEQRAAVEERRAASPALREAKRQGLPFEKLRLLSRLPEGEIAAWVPRAHALTCVELRRRLEGEAERQMRAKRRVAVSLPLRVAALLAAAIQSVRERVGGKLSVGRCLAIVAYHFLDTWAGVVRRWRSSSQKVRDRDEGHCQVPGCSHRAVHSHHVLFRSQGGGDDAENQVGLCAFHHLRCIHGGRLRVFGRAPDALRWFLDGEPWGPAALAGAAPLAVG